MVMILRAFASEWIKMRRRRLWFGSYGAITGVVLLTTIVSIAGALHHPDRQGDLTLAQLGYASGLSQGLNQSGVLLGAVSFSIAAAPVRRRVRPRDAAQPPRAPATQGRCSWPASAWRCSPFSSARSWRRRCSASVPPSSWRTSGASRRRAWTSGVGMGDLGVALGDLALSTCGFAIVGMILGLLLRSSVIAIGAGLALLLPFETILTDAVPGPPAGCPASCSRRSPRAAPRMRPSAAR